MFKKMSLSVASLALLSACSACSTIPNDGSSMDAMDTMDKTTKSSYEASVKATPSKAALEKVAVMYTGNRAYFDFDSAALSAESQARLKAIATRIKATNPSKIIVEGHCDERGTREYNLALGDRRAVSAKKYLVGLGVDSNKIRTISYGKERPMNLAHNANAWAKNRRAVVKF